MAGRNEHRDELRPLLVQALSAGTAEHWHQRLQEVGVPCAPILGIDEGVRYAESLGLEPIVQVGSGEDTVPLIKHPVTYSRTPATYTRRPPALGADQQCVLAWIQTTPPIAAGSAAAASPRSTRSTQETP